MIRNSDSHLEAIESALDLIENGVQAPLDLDQIARNSGMSFWHFQRTFAALTGEPVGSYVRRRRLSAAAHDLLRTRRRILDIALDYQFESHSAFTRAFRTMFGISPDQFRRDPISLWSTRPKLTNDGLRHLQRIGLQPEFVELPALHLLGICTRFISISSEKTNSTTVLPSLWKAFLPRISDIAGAGVSAGSLEPALAPCRFGAWDSLPANDRTDPDELQYLASISVSPLVNTPTGMVQWTAPSSRYARFIHKGPIGRISETISYIYAVWLPRSGLKRGTAFDLEYYDHRFRAESEGSELEYYLPLAP